MGGNNMIASHFLASAMPNEAIGYTRALPDITSGPEVRQIFKIRTVWKPEPDVFLPCAGLLKIEKNPNIFSFSFPYFCFCLFI